MNDISKMYQELIEENAFLKKRIQELEQSETERKQAEEALKVSEEKYRKIFEGATEGIFQTTPEGRYLSVNPAFARMAGFASPREMTDSVENIGQQLYVNPDDREEMVRRLREHDEVEGYEAEIYRKDGNRFWISINAHTVRDGSGEILYFEGTNTDITERKKAVDALHESEERYRLLFEEAIEGIFRTTLDGRLVMINGALARMLGYDSPQDALQRITDIGTQVYANPEERKALIGRLLREDKVRGSEMVFKRSDGSIMNVMLNFRLARDERGAPVFIEGSCIDITDRCLAEEALKVSEEKYRNIFEGATEGIFQTTPEGRCLNVNPAFARMFGYSSPEEMIAAITDIGRQLHVNPMAREEMVRRLREHDKVSGYEVEVYRRDGSRFWISINIHTVRDASGNILYFEGTSTDITERKRAEGELQKLASIVRHSSEAINLATPDGKMIFLNEAGSRMLGIDGNRVHEFNIRDVIPDRLLPMVESEILPALMTVGTWEGELQGRNVKTGSLTDVYATAFVIADPVSKSPLYLANISRDITEQKRAEEALKQSESRLSNIIEFLPDATFAIDLEGKIITWNRAIEEMTGFSAETMLGKGNYEYAIPFYGERRPILVDFLSLWNNDIAKRYSFINKDGDTLYTETDAPFVRGHNRTLWGKASPLRNEKGDIIGAIESIRDITDHKKAEEALRKAEEKYRSIFENAIEGIFQTRPDGRYISANPALATMYGYDSPEEMVETVTDIQRQQYVNPEDRETFKNLLDTQGFVERFETQLYGRDGEKIWVSISARAARDADGRITHYEGTTEDITKRRQIEEELRRSNALYRTIFDNSGTSMIIINEDTTIVLCNEEWTKLSGYSREETEGRKSWTEFIHEEDLAVMRKHYANRPVDPLAAPRRYGCRGVDRYGNMHNMINTVATIPGTRMIVAAQLDITDLKQAEKALLDSEEKYRSVVENSPVGVYIVKDGLFRYVNRRFSEITGYGYEELADKRSPLDIVHPDDRELVAENLSKRVAGEVDLIEYDFRGVRKDGRIVILRVFGTTMMYEGERVVAGSILDVTREKHLEAQLLQSQKMEAIGTLAGGIAHDFNNILTAIIGYVSLLQMDMGNDPKRQYADQILASSQKAAILTQSLLAFGRKQVMELRPRKINEIVKEAEKLLKRLLTEDIDFTVIQAKPDMTVEADVTQIDQVLMNLATNARDAMPGGGRLTIETKAVCLDNSFVESHGLGIPGEYALISVTDTGMGMDRETQEKIFEPFFTTKEVGKGTGLGLSIVYGIVKQHNGYLAVSSEPGKGTRFDVYLPIVKAAAEKTTQSFEHAAGGNETILVAEDNSDVRGLSKAILSSRGYAVLEAVDGADAVRQFVQHKDEIDLLLFDVVMPGKNGKEAYEEIRRLRQDVKVLFTSGYTGDIVLIKGISDEAINYISKPLTPNELLRKVREVLDK